MTVKTTTKNKLNTRMVWASVAVLLAMVALSTWAWFQLPAGAEIPVHWDVNGNPDRYGGKIEGLFLLPIISVGVLALIAVVPLIEPRQKNMQLSSKAYSAVWWMLLVILGGVHIVTVMAALGSPVRVDLVISLLIGGMFVVIGNYMGKVRSNFMFGIRTPWTLTSELSWNKTHRLGGRLFVGIGLLLIAIGLFRPGAWMIYFLIASILGGVVFLFGYSYLIWKQDPNAKTMQELK